MAEIQQRRGFGRGTGGVARWTAVVALVGALAGAAGAAPAAATVAEMDSLLSALGSSGCRFQRNGTWYDADQAVAHLRKKRAWLEKHDKIRRTEDFIRLGATESSMSGKPYTMACPGKPTVESRLWLEARLAALRSKPR